MGLVDEQYIVMSGHKHPQHYKILDTRSIIIATTITVLHFIQMSLMLKSKRDCSEHMTSSDSYPTMLRGCGTTLLMIFNS